MKANHLVIGMGEVGSAVCNVLIQAKYNVETKDAKDEVIGQFDYLHICLPFSSEFVRIVNSYQKEFKPKCTIIYSTVAVGTTKKIKGAVHSPVEGKHPRLDFGVKTFTRYIGHNNYEEARLARNIWNKITPVRLVRNSDSTEFLKLASTSKYGINIVWAQYMADCAQEIGFDYELVKDWDRSYNELYTRMHLGQFKKFVLDSPNDKIGGHCVTENASLLNKQHPNKMLDMIEAMS